MTQKELENKLDSLKDIKDEEYITQINEAGFSRISAHIPPFHLICPELERRVALVYKEGLNKYKDDDITEAEVTTSRFNGPLDNLIKHAKNHFNLWLQGNRTEDHLAKIAWAIQQIMHQETDCDHYNIFLKEENRFKSNTLENGKTK